MLEIQSSWLLANQTPRLITYSFSLVALLIGSITDLKTREVPDWINYGLIISGVFVNLILSVIYSDFSLVIGSIAGLLAMFIIACIMFYAGQWGGGDSKILMGIGAMVGVKISLSARQFLLAFLVNSLLIGALYGLMWAVLLLLKKRRGFLKELRLISKQRNACRLKIIMLILVAVLLGLFFVYWTGLLKHEIFFLSSSLIFLALLTSCLWIFTKAVEKSCMHKLVLPRMLTEGDWIVNEIYVGGKYVCGPKDLGIQKNQINKLVKYYGQGKIKKVLIKEGIPFVPSFFMAFIATLFFGNPIFWVL